MVYSPNTPGTGIGPSNDQSPMSMPESAPSAKLVNPTTRIVATSEAAFAIAEEIQPARSWYIGVHDRTTEGTWQSPEGVDVSFRYFAPGEPDDFGGEDCAVLASFSGGQWADEKCGSTRPYICEVTK